MSCDFILFISFAQYNDEDFDINLANWRLVSEGNVRFKFGASDVIRRKQYCVVAKGIVCLFVLEIERIFVFLSSCFTE